MTAIATTTPISKSTMGTIVTMATIMKVVEDIIEKEFTPHPFESGVSQKNVRPLIAEYLAMSEAFPYVQAGAQRNWIEDAIQKKKGVEEDTEVTAAVANFLTADETGVKYVLDRFGVQGLPKILDSKDNFHSALLKKDLVALFGEVVEPNYSDVTGKYLLALLSDLSDLDPVKRVAAMCAFERHAGTMIEALWDSIAKLFPSTKKESLTYFFVHVGGADPAEPYHQAMTARMIERCVPETRAEDFVESFRRAYNLCFTWCRLICDLN